MAHSQRHFTFLPMRRPRGMCAAGLPALCSVSEVILRRSFDSDLANCCRCFPSREVATCLNCWKSSAAASDALWLVLVHSPMRPVQCAVLLCLPLCLCLCLLSSACLQTHMRHWLCLEGAKRTANRRPVCRLCLFRLLFLSFSLFASFLEGE